MRPCRALAALCAVATSGCGAPLGGSADAGDQSDQSAPPQTASDGGPISHADAGPADAGVFLAADVAWKETGFDLIAVDRAGTAYAVSTDGSDTDLWASADGRSWTRRGAAPDGDSFWVMTARALAPWGTVTAVVTSPSPTSSASARATISPISASVRLMTVVKI